MAVLKIYEKALRQIVNLEKSCIVFSLNTSEFEKRQILARFRLSKSRAHDK